MTYDIPTASTPTTARSSSPTAQRPLYVNSIAIGNDGAVYALSRYNRNGHKTTDLMSVRP